MGPQPGLLLAQRHKNERDEDRKVRMTLDKTVRKGGQEGKEWVMKEKEQGKVGNNQKTKQRME